MEPFISNYIEYLDLMGDKCLLDSFEVVRDTILEPGKTTKEDISDKIDNSAIKHLTIQFIKELLQTPKEDWKKQSKIYGDFKTLSENLASSTLKDKDKVSIIFWILERNISTGITEENAETELLGVNALECCDTNIGIYKDIKEKMYSGTSLFNSIISTLNQSTNNMSNEEIEVQLNTKLIDLKKVAKEFRIIKKHYFNKINTFNKEDIDIIIQSLKNLGVVDEINSIILKSLTTKIVKRENCAKKKEYVPTEKKETPHRSYNEIQQELLKYYNFAQNTVTADNRMSLNEIIHCITLLNELGAHKEQLYTFIKAATISNNQYEINPINLYNEQYYRLDYYKDKLGLQTEFENLQDLYQELFLLGGEDYEFGKKLFEDDLNAYLKCLPNNSDYEIEQAKQLIKTPSNNSQFKQN